MEAMSIAGFDIVGGAVVVIQSGLGLLNVDG